MKNFLKRILPTKIFIYIRDIFYPEKINLIEERLSSFFVTQNQSIASPNLSQKTAFRNAEFKIYSKHGCDGILAYIFSKIGVKNHTFVEIGVEDGQECNTANLSRNYGWQGLMVDANKEWIRKAKNLYREYKVKAVAGFVTAENINQLIQDNNIKGEIDLLSIDIDGNDFWIWKAIDVINPRVVVIEYNAAFGLRPITVKYNPEFNYQETYKENPLYSGVSLAALSKLAKKKGYHLVACDTHGHDAFFVKKEVAKGKFAELSPEEAFYPNPYNLKEIGSIDEQFERIEHLHFEKV